MRRRPPHPHQGSIGLIGSAAKWSRFRRLLLEAGHDVAAVERIRCPIGRPGLTGKAPAVIAIGVAADLVQAMQPPPPLAGATAQTPADRVDADRVDAEHVDAEPAP